MEAIRIDGSFSDWVEKARAALYSGTTPESIEWSDARSSETSSLWEDRRFERQTASERQARVPRRFISIAEEACLHRDPGSWALLYRMLWRLTHGEPHLLEVVTDPDVHEILKRQKAVSHDLHQMRAFVRFREVQLDGNNWFVAWYEPQHHIVERNAPFFRDRFTALHWSILTPDRSVSWDGDQLHFAPGVARPETPGDDAMETLWRTYYKSIFNPARLNLRTTTSHMPKRFWKNLPEAEMIPKLADNAAPRVVEMERQSAAKQPVADFIPVAVPEKADHAKLALAVQSCRGCPLWRDASCAVFGEGPTEARLVVVGEQPGDQEDRAGRPFVGPAGQLMNRALLAAGISREQLYITNAVKHFKWTPRGKRRLHAKPNAREIAACRPWLEAEIEMVRPDLIVCLGATAAGTIVGPDVRVTEKRGEFLETQWKIPALITVHPSSLLRLGAEADAEQEFQRFVSDLSKMKRGPGFAKTSLTR